MVSDGTKLSPLKFLNDFIETEISFQTSGFVDIEQIKLINKRVFNYY